MTEPSLVTRHLLKALIESLRADGWSITPPRPARDPSTSPFWTADKIELVRELWPNPAISTAEICRRTGRSINAVKHQARNIGVQRSARLPAKKSDENPALRKSAEILAETPQSCLEMPAEILRERKSEPSIAAPNEVISTSVADHAVAARMPDRDPLPAPRKGKRGGIDRTGDMMGDPGHANRREIEAQYSKDGSALG